MQGTQVRTRSGMIPHVVEHLSLLHNYWASVLEPRSYNYWVHVLQILKPMHPRTSALQQEKPTQWEAHMSLLESSPCSPQLEKASSAMKT